MAVLLKPLLCGNAMSRRSLRVLKNASSAIVSSQQVMASYQRCIAAHAASDFMGRVFTSGSSLAASQTAHIANLLGSSLVTLLNECKRCKQQWPKNGEKEKCCGSCQEPLGQSKPLYGSALARVRSAAAADHWLAATFVRLVRARGRPSRRRRSKRASKCTCSRWVLEPLGTYFSQINNILADTPVPYAACYDHIKLHSRSQCSFEPLISANVLNVVCSSWSLSRLE